MSNKKLFFLTSKLTLLSQYLLIIIIFFTILLRAHQTYQELSQPLTPFSDFGRDILVAKHIFQHNAFVAPQSSIPILKNTPFYFWIIGIAYFFGKHIGIYIFFFSAGVLEIYIAYLFGERFKKNSGLIFAALLSTNIVFIKTSLELWQPNFIPLFILLFMNYMLLYVKKQKIIFLVSALLFFYLASFFHYSGILLIPSLILFIISLVFTTHKKISHLFIFAGTSFLMLLSNGILSYYSNSVENAFFAPLSIIEKIKLTPEKMISAFTLIGEMTRQLINIPLWFVIGYFLIMIYFDKKSNKPISRKVLITIFGICLTLYLTIVLIPLQEVPLYYLISFYPIISFIPLIFIHIKNKILKPFSYLIIIFILIQNVLNLKQVINHYHDTSRSDHYKKIAQVIYQDKKDKNIKKILSLDENCLELNPSINKTFFCLNEWSTSLIWYEIENISNQNLVETINYHNNIQSIHLSDTQAITYFVCLPTQEKHCQMVISEQSCYKKVGTVEKYQIFADHCKK